MRSPILHSLTLIIIATQLVWAIVSIFKGNYEFAALFAGLSSIQGDLLRARMREEQ